MSKAKIKVHFNANTQHSHSYAAARFVRLESATLDRRAQTTSVKGWSSCSKCPCSGFVQSYGSDICGRCGHNYYEHW